MCGLVGVYGNIGKDEVAAFKNLLQIDVIRGPHSTGVASMNVKGEVEVIKKAFLPDDLFCVKKFNELVNSTSKRCFLGHNRWATKGKINSANAHPFEHEHIIGAHNGTLKGQWRLEDHQHFEVDSDNIFHHIRKRGIENCWENLDGAAALTFFDTRKGSFNIIRNDERTLYITISQDGNTMFYASENWMLLGALARNGIKHREIVSIGVDTLYSFNYNDRAKHNKVIVSTKKLSPLKNRYGVIGSAVSNQTTTVTVSSNGAKVKTPTPHTRVELEIAMLHGTDNTNLMILRHRDYPGVEFRLSCLNAPARKLRDSLIRDGLKGAKISGKVLAAHQNHVNKSWFVYVDDSSARVVRENPEKKNHKDTDKGVTINGYEITRLEFEQSSKLHTCGWCDQHISFDDIGTTFIKGAPSQEAVLCEDCLKQEGVKEYIVGDL